MHPYQKSSFDSYKTGNYKPGNSNFITEVKIIDKIHASIVREPATNIWGVILLVDTVYDLPVDVYVEREFRRMECFSSEQEAQIYCDIHGYRVISFIEFGDIVKRLKFKYHDD